MILKFFLFMFLLVILALVGVGFIFRRMKSAFSFKINNQEKEKRTTSKDDNVIYNKDNVVVLKGEANETKRTYGE